MSDTPKLRLSGPARAAIVMLALGEDVDVRGTIRCPSLLIGEMTIAGD